MAQKDGKICRLNCRVSPEEKRAVEASAKRKEVNISEYIRQALFCKPVPGITVQDLDAVGQELTYQVRKIGVNINQLAKAANGRYFRDQEREELFLAQEKLEALMEQYIAKLDRIREKGAG